MNLNNLTIKARDVIQRSQQLAQENGQQAIEPGHVLKALLDLDDSVAPFIFKKMGASPQVIKQATDSIVQSYPKVTGGEPYLARPTAALLTKANSYLKTFGDEFVALEHLLLGLLTSNDQIGRLLKDSGLTEKGMVAAIRWWK